MLSRPKEAGATFRPNLISYRYKYEAKNINML